MATRYPSLKIDVVEQHMKKSMNILTKLTNKIRCKCGVHDCTRKFVGTSNEYRGNLLPRIEVVSCKHCNYIDFDVEMVIKKDTDANQ